MSYYCTSDILAVADHALQQKDKVHSPHPPNKTHLWKIIFTGPVNSKQHALQIRHKADR